LRPSEATASDRGVSEVIGFVLVLGLLVLALATIQLGAVPIWNEGVELDHNEQVQDEMQDVRSAMLTTATSGGSASESLKLGTDYPNRVVLRNPLSSTGRLETTVERTVTVENATLGGNADLFWDSMGGNVTLETRDIRYTPSYNEYRNAPTTSYENSVVYNDQGNGTAPISGQSVVDNNRISLVFVNGSLSETGSRRVNVDTSPLSAPANSLSVTDDASAGNLTLELPTNLSEGNWENLLRDETLDEGGNVVNVSKPGDSVRIELANSTEYTLRTAKVGVGDETAETKPAYITDVEGDNESVPAGTTVTLVAEVRDKYSNGVQGATAKVADDTGNKIDGQERTTDPDGRASFRYDTSGLLGTQEVEAEIQGATEEYENVTFTVDVFDSGAASSGGGAYTTFWKTADFTLDASSSTSTALTMGTSPVTQGARVEYAVNNTTVGTVSQSIDDTNSDGENTTVLSANENGTVKVYTSSGGSGDVVNVTVENFPPQPVVYNNDAQAVDNDDAGGTNESVRFSITGQADATITDMKIESPDAAKVSTDSSTPPWNHEVTVDTSDFGFADEGTAYSLGDRIVDDGYETDGTFENNVSSGETATVYISKFLDSGGNQVDMNNKDVTVTFYFDAASPVTFSFTLPPTRFASLTADGSFSGASGNVQSVDFSGEVNNPDGNGEVRFRLLDAGSQYNNDAVTMTRNFGPVNLDADNRAEPITVVAELIDNDDNVYQSCEAQLDQASDPLTLGDFTCT